MKIVYINIIILFLTVLCFFFIFVIQTIINYLFTYNEREINNPLENIRIIYNEDNISPNKEYCSICLDYKDNIMTLPCNHKFNKDCLSEWHTIEYNTYKKLLVLYVEILLNEIILFYKQI